MDKCINNRFSEDKLYFSMIMLWLNSFVVDGVPSFVVNLYLNGAFSALHCQWDYGDIGGQWRIIYIIGQWDVIYVFGLCITYIFPHWCTHLWDQRIS